ncbi:MAG: hypothetical protein ACAF41_11865 [Leptolyngbya sp. BL-A-14]
MPDPTPLDGQYFQLHPVQPPKPKPGMSWGVPLSIGLLSIPLLMFGFGFSQQQRSPEPAQALTPSPIASAANLDALLPTPTPSATPETQQFPVIEPSPIAQQPIDSATLPVAKIKAFNMAANLRTAPSLYSRIEGVLFFDDLVELRPDRRVQQDGVVWVPVRYRGVNGWVAQNFIGGSLNGI